MSGIRMSGDIAPPLSATDARPRLATVVALLVGGVVLITLGVVVLLVAVSRSTAHSDVWYGAGRFARVPIVLGGVLGVAGVAGAITRARARQPGRYVDTEVWSGVREVPTGNLLIRRTKREHQLWIRAYRIDDNVRDEPLVELAITDEQASELATCSVVALYGGRRGGWVVGTSSLVFTTCRPGGSPLEPPVRIAPT